MRQHKKSTFRLSLKPVLAALLAIFPSFSSSASSAAVSEKTDRPENASSTAGNDLPDLGKQAGDKSALNASVGPGGVQFDARFDRQKVIVAPQYSDQTGASLGVAYATLLGDYSALGLAFSAGRDTLEVLVNAGFKIDSRQQLIASFGQLQQRLDFGFRSGTEKAVMTQNSGGLNYQYVLGSSFLRQIEGVGYVANTPSQKLSDKTFAVDTSSYYELWNDPRRIAGGTVMGYQGKLGVSPIDGGLLKFSLGQERVIWDLLTGKEDSNRITAGVEWKQLLPGHTQVTLAAEDYATQTRYSAGLEKTFLDFGSGRHAFGARYTGVRGRDGVGDDNQLQLTWVYSFGTGRPGGSGAYPMAALKAAGPSAPDNRDSTPSSRAIDQSLLDAVAQRPSYMPSHVVAKVDTTALPTRLVLVQKAALPTGSSVNTATGDVTVPLGVAVTGIAGVTRNGAAFANGNQFAASGSNLIVRPSQITQPAVGVTETYVVTLDNVGGGTTLATVLVSHGSVVIDSIVVSTGGADTTPPSTTSAPAISTPATATTVSVTQTINETGTGYYLIQAASLGAPSVAAVMAGTSFAMTAATPTIVNITGLAASTAYKYYFVAKDAANNAQTAISAELAITTTAAVADTTPPTTSDTITPAQTTASVVINSNEAGEIRYIAQLATAGAPTLAAIKAGTQVAMVSGGNTISLTGLSAVTSYKIYYVAKDSAGNWQAAETVKSFTTTAVADTTPPSTPATLTLTGNAGASAGFTNTESIATTVADVTDPSGVSWFVSESSSVPAANAAGWSSTKPTSFTLTAGAAEGLRNVYVFVKDNASPTNNVQATGKIASITLDTAVPTITSLPNWTGGVASGSTTAASVTFGDTAGGTPKAVSITADNGAAITGFSGAYGARNFNLVAPTNSSGSPITVTITYSVTDNAGNVTTTTQSVNVAAAATLPATPANFALVNDSGTSGDNITNDARFTWMSVAGATAYEVSTNGTSWTDIGNTVSYDFSNLDNSNGTKTAYLRAKNVAGVSATQATKSFTLDTIPPAAPTGLALDGGNATTTLNLVALVNLTSPADAEAWFVSESATAPAANAAGWLGAMPTTYSFATATNEVKTVCVYVKDKAGNVQSTGSCDMITKVP